MSSKLPNARGRAFLAAGALFALGMVVGVAVDRMLAQPAWASTHGEPLTVESMSRTLDLDAAEQERVGSLVDSLEADVMEAAAAGADSLRTVARRAREQIEAALPHDRRERFQSWMQEHHDRMMQGMGRGRMRGMMRDGGMGRGMMRDRGTGRGVTDPRSPDPEDCEGPPDRRPCSTEGSR